MIGQVFPNFEEQYVIAKKTILESIQNKGEKDEVIVLIDLFHANRTNQYDKLISIFGEEAAEGINILNMDTMDEILDIHKLSKAGSGFKADCMIKMKKTQNIYCISIKSKNGANPAILNHTPRNAKVFREGGILCDYIDSLDTVLGEYIDKRTKKIIGEDVKFTSLESVKDPFIQNQIMNVLTYFVFEGSGKGDSKCKANAIITYHGETISFITCVTIEEKKKYIETIYDRTILSLRDKGMPKLITDCCSKWTFIDIKPDGLVKCKGSLHIRMK